MNKKRFKQLHMLGLVMGAAALFLVNPAAKHWSFDMGLALATILFNAFHLGRIYRKENPQDVGVMSFVSFWRWF